jgi:hypothetical protein
MLRVRYAELLRLREYVQRLESAKCETTEPWSTVKRYEFESGRRFSQSFTTGGDWFADERGEPYAFANDPREGWKSWAASYRST